MNIYSEDKMYESYSSEVERMQKCIDELQQENQELKKQLEQYQEEVCILDMKTDENIKLQNNWNELKEYCLNEQIPEEYYEYNSYIEFSNSAYEDVLNKMQELEGNNE